MGDIISKKMEKHILLGNLIEKQAVSVIQMYFTQRIIDEVSAYCIQDWKDLSYQQIMSTLQFLYIPLNLHLFQSLVLAYRVEGNVLVMMMIVGYIRGGQISSEFYPDDT